MKRLLIALHVGLIATPLLPTYATNWADSEYVRLPLLENDVLRMHRLPLDEAIRYLSGYWALRSVLAAGLPGFPAFLNLPVFLMAGDRWRAVSSVVLGLLSASTMVQLLSRYGEGREWGAWAIWILSLLLTIAGAFAIVRLKPESLEPEEFGWKSR